jgi:hypothetical protein
MFAEKVPPAIVYVSVIDACRVRIEADGGVTVVDAEQLIERRRDGWSIRVVHIGEGAADIGEAEIGIHADIEVRIRPEADCRPRRCLDQSPASAPSREEIFIGEVRLAIWRHDRVAFVRVSCCSTSEITSDDRSYPKRCLRGKTSSLMPHKHSTVTQITTTYAQIWQLADNQIVWINNQFYNNPAYDKGAATKVFRYQRVALPYGISSLIR